MLEICQQPPGFEKPLYSIGYNLQSGYHVLEKILKSNRIYLLAILTILLSLSAIVSACAGSSPKQAQPEISAQAQVLEPQSDLKPTEIVAIWTPVSPSSSIEEPSAEAVPLLASSTSQEINPEDPAPAATQARQGQSFDNQAEQPEPAEPAANLPPEDARVGFSAPNFTLQNLDGDRVQLSDLRGKNILLNYWVTWCIPCKEEIPILEKLQKEYAQDLVVLSINGIQQDSLDKVKSFIAENHMNLSVVLDQSDTIYLSYRVSFMPTSFFIDDQGIIRHIMLGSATDEKFHNLVEQLISKQF